MAGPRACRYIPIGGLADTFVVMAALNGAIALAYLVMATWLAPRLGLPSAGRFAAIAFFTACGLTHAELMLHTLDARPAWMVSGHMFAIHGTQAVVDWGFIAVAVRSLDLQFTRRLSGAARRLAEAQQLAGFAAWEWHPRRDRLHPSPELARMLGRPASWEPRLAGLLGHVVAADRERAAADLRALPEAPDGTTLELEVAVTRCDGEERTLLVRAERSDGRVIAATQDVTERRAAEASRARALEAERRLEREHRIAETLQRSLLPARLPDVPALELAARYLPAGAGTEVGGDWYDVLELPGGDVALVMGDVVGRGIPAAALVGKLRNALRAYAAEGHPPEVALEHLNALVDRTDREMATVLLMTFTPTTGAARWVSAGHPPALVRRADGSREFLEGGRSVPLGALAHARYTAATGTLDPGDMVLLYTDGLVERRGIPLDSTLEALRAAAVQNGSAGALCDATVGALLPGGAGGDDVAVLAALVRGRGHTLELDLDARPEALAAMRRRLRAWLAERRTPEELTERVLLCVNEAATNAVEHAYGPGAASFAVRAIDTDARLAVEVRDGGSWRAPRGRDGGRGLLLMRALADDVEVRPGEEGTVVALGWRHGG
jgi:anti-sigma regulatory factor (Ser/Thr protein kinase)